MEPPVQKNFLFDALLPRVEWVAWLLAIASVVLAYFSYPRANIFLFLGFSTLATVYFSSSFAPSATAKTSSNQAIAVTLVGIQFKLLFLPGYNTLLTVGLSIIAVVLAIQGYANNSSRKALIIVALGATVAYIPTDEFVRQFYRHDPILSEKMLYHLHHPKDKAAAEEDAQLFTWIYRIATNECLSFLQSKRRKFFLPLNDVGAELAAKLEADPAVAGDEIELKLQKAILRLPDKQRLVFNLRYYDEMPYEQMAEVTGTSVGALKASY
nr:hypothetical protein [Tanacetum cinerariifolium]